MNSILDDVLVNHLMELLGPVERQLLSEGKQGVFSKRIYEAMNMLRQAHDANCTNVAPSPLHGETTATGLSATVLAFEALSDAKHFLAQARVQAVTDGSVSLGVDQALFEKFKDSHGRYRAEMGKYLKST